MGALSAAALAAGTVLAALVVAGTAGTAPGDDGIAAPRSVRPGDPFLVRVPRGTGPPPEVEFLGRRHPPLEIPGEPRAVFLLGADLDAAPGPAEIVVRGPAGERTRRPVTIEARRFPEERLTLPPAMVTPPRDLEERIAREQELTAGIYRTSAPAQLWEGGFGRALERPAAGNFGKRRILNGVPRSPHAGQDYTAPAGTPVRAIAGGRVRLARELYYSGLTVLVDHGAGLVSQYLHLREMLVKEGQLVAAGAPVGEVGSTGRATGPHLHLGLRLFERRVDPERLLALLPRP